MLINTAPMESAMIVIEEVYVNKMWSQRFS